MGERSSEGEKEAIAKAFLDDQLSSEGIEPEEFFGLVRALGKCSGLAKVWPDLEVVDGAAKGRKVFYVGATYKGELDFSQSDGRSARLLYAHLGKETGIEFDDPKGFATNPPVYSAKAMVEKGEPVKVLVRRV